MAVRPINGEAVNGKATDDMSQHDAIMVSITMLAKKACDTTVENTELFSLLNGHHKLVNKVLLDNMKANKTVTWITNGIGYTAGLSEVFMTRDRLAIAVVVMLAKAGYNLDSYYNLLGLAAMSPDPKSVVKKFVLESEAFTPYTNVKDLEADAMSWLETSTSDDKTETAAPEEKVEEPETEETMRTKLNSIHVEETDTEAEMNAKLEEAARLQALLEELVKKRTAEKIETIRSYSGGSNEGTSWGDAALGIGGVVLAGLAIYAGYCYFFDGCESSDTIIID